MNTQKVLETSMVGVTIRPNGDDGTCDPFELSPYLSNSLNVGSNIIDVPSMQEEYTHLCVLDPFSYSYARVEFILGQDVYHAIRPIEYYEGESKHSPVAVRLPLAWVLSGPLPSPSNFVSTCFKAVVEQESTLGGEIKFWYDMESFGAVKQVDPRSASDRRAAEILEKTTVHENGRYHVGMLWSVDDLVLPNNYFSALVQMKSLEKRLCRDPRLKQQYNETIQVDLEKGYVVEVKDPHEPQCRSTKEWYLPHHPVFHPLKPGKVRLALNGAAKFHGWSLNKALLTGPDLLQRLIHVLLRFRQHRYAVSADIEGFFSRWVFQSMTNRHYVFCGEMTQHKMLLYTNTQGIFSALEIHRQAQTMAYNVRALTMSLLSQVHRAQSSRSFTWTIIWTQWVLAKKPFQRPSRSYKF